MAKKINKKLNLKRETLRSLTADELGHVVGGTSDAAQTGVKGTTQPGPTKTDTGSAYQSAAAPVVQPAAYQGGYNYYH